MAVQRATKATGSCCRRGVGDPNWRNHLAVVASTCCWEQLYREHLEHQLTEYVGASAAAMAGPSHVPFPRVIDGPVVHDYFVDGANLGCDPYEQPTNHIVIITFVIIIAIFVFA